MNPPNLSTNDSLLFRQDDGGIFFLRVSPPVVVEKVLELAELEPGETPYDLGSGDGRIIASAAERFRARAVGIELNKDLVEVTRKSIRELGLGKMVSARHEDLCEANIDDANVLVVYVDGPTVNRVESKLRRRFMAEGRIITIDQGIPGWQPAKQDTARDSDGNEYAIYLYKERCAVADGDARGLRDHRQSQER